MCGDLLDSENGGARRGQFDRQRDAVELPADPIWLDGDLTRLAQVVGNLLNNAAKYTPEKGQISKSFCSPIRK